MGTNVHNQMHKIRHLFSKEEYEWHQRHNKLGINCWGTHTGSGLILLNGILNRDDLTINPFPNSEEYSSMSFNEKRELCDWLDDKLYAILKKLYFEYS